MELKDKIYIFCFILIIPLILLFLVISYVIYYIASNTRYLHFTRKYFCTKVFNWHSYEKEYLEPSIGYCQRAKCLWCGYTGNYNHKIGWM